WSPSSTPSNRGTRYSVRRNPASGACTRSGGCHETPPRSRPEFIEVPRDCFFAWVTAHRAELQAAGADASHGADRRLMDKTESGRRQQALDFLLIGRRRGHVRIPQASLPHPCCDRRAGSADLVGVDGYDRSALVSAEQGVDARVVDARVAEA